MDLANIVNQSEPRTQPLDRQSAWAVGVPPFAPRLRKLNAGVPSALLLPPNQKALLLPHADRQRHPYTFEKTKTLEVLSTHLKESAILQHTCDPVCISNPHKVRAGRNHRVVPSMALPKATYPIRANSAFVLKPDSEFHFRLQTNFNCINFYLTLLCYLEKWVPVSPRNARTILSGFVTKACFPPFSKKVKIALIFGSILPLPN